MRCAAVSIFLMLAGGACVDFDAAQASCVERGGCQTAFEAPSLTATSPVNQATDVAVTTALSLTFSKAMDKASVGRPTISPPVVLSEPQWSADGTSFVIQPLAPLGYETTYTVSVTGRSQEGGALAAGASFSFTTARAPDTVGPTLVATTPSNGLQGVDVTTTLSLTFSEVIAPASLEVQLAPTLGLGAATWEPDGQTVRFEAPLDPWAPNTTYVIQVAATDLAGNTLQGTRSFSFKTAQAVTVDTTPPTVVVTLPTPLATNVEVRTNVSVTFSEPVKLGGATFEVSPDAGCTPALDVTNTRLSCNNLDVLTGQTTYVVTVPTTVQDVAGNALAAPFIFQFQTGTPPDAVKPTILSVNPPDGGANFAVRQPMVVSFSEPMDQAATQSAFAITSPAATPTPSFTWSSDGRTVTATPTADFPFSQVVRWQVGAAAADLAGNTMVTSQAFSFQVVPDTVPPTVVSTAPSATAMNLDPRLNFSVTFSEPMSSTGLALIATPDAGCVPALDASGTRVSCNNPIPLRASTSYAVTVPTSVRDVAGNVLASPYSFTFQTGAVPDTTRPTIVSVSPPDAGTGVPLTGATITVRFSEAMDQASVQSAFAFIDPPTQTATFAWSSDGLTLTATPVQAFSYNQVVKWQVGGGAKDLAGNSIIAGQQFLFRVLRQVTAMLTPINSGSTLNGVGTSGLFVGDSPAPANYRAFLVYSLPAGIVGVQNVNTMQLSESLPLGTPYSSNLSPPVALNMFIEAVPYIAPISNDEAVAAPLSFPGRCVVSLSTPRCCTAETLSTSPATASSTLRTLVNSAKLTGMFNQAVTQGLSRVALRIRRGYASNCEDFYIDTNGQNDYVRYADPSSASPPTLQLTYSVP